MSNVIQFSQPYSLAFQHAIQFVLDKEGGLRPDMGYVNDPKDRGGETKAGISKRAYPNEDIKNLTLDRAIFLYHRDYWRQAYCAELPAGISLAVFDGAVQHGWLSSVKMLQEVMGVKDDGIIGPKTKAAIVAMDPEWVLARLLLRRARFYGRILLKNPSQGRFFEGWHNRLAHLSDACWQVVEGSANPDYRKVA
ncbi:peptidoglycan-binding protein [Aeromonas sp. 2692-1]|nr:peptidoglycan-binding protein [Aeromonas sp. 2692-1]QJT15244.1 peptidoglycan-binding protein [Aeromonas sp. 2692-1]